MKAYLKLIRPPSWIKNFFIFVPLFFAKDFFNTGKLIAVLYTFIAFCLTASCVYILNDIADRNRDKEHEKKKFRPLAAGLISLQSAISFFFILLIIVLIGSYLLIPQIIPLLAIYFLLNVGYSFYFKHIAPVDILLISSMYLIRISIGGIAASVPVSNWLLLCTIFISLFLIIGKRIAELRQKNKREVLNSYTEEFLNGLLIMSATLSVMSYGLYTVLVLNSYTALCSIFFVLLGIMRYLYIILTTHKSEYPEHAIISDPTVLVSVVLWLVSMFCIFYLHI